VKWRRVYSQCTGGAAAAGGTCLHAAGGGGGVNGREKSKREKSVT